MTDEQIIIDVCPYQGECSVSGCKRNDDGCFVRQLFEERYRAENQIVDLNKMVEAKEQECEGLNKELRKNFKEKDTLHLIIDRLLEASGYDTNTASAEDFEDVYENIRYEKQQLDQLKGVIKKYEECIKYLVEENGKTYTRLEYKLLKTLTEIKEIAERNIYLKSQLLVYDGDLGQLQHKPIVEILQKISEVKE